MCLSVYLIPEVALTAMECLKTELKSKLKQRGENNTDKQIQRRNTKSESNKQKFTPSTGLRLRVPLQWVPIQLIFLKWYKMVLETTSATVSRMLYKIFKTFLSKLQSAFKDKES